MCTAITFHTDDHYFGRNLDLEYHYQEQVTVTPRNFTFAFRKCGAIENHPALIGMATISDGYPLYYDATNENGLSVAGLNFPGNAVYNPASDQKDNIAPFELIPWILCQCATVCEAEALLSGINLWNEPFNAEYSLSPLHWIVADQNRSVTVEPMADGLRIQENPVGVLTNNPPFDYHMYNLANYMNLSPDDPIHPFSGHIQLKPYGRGHGGIGLPGDLSSASRFVRAVFTKLHSVCDHDEASSISQFFHVLGSVEQQQGCVKVGQHYEKTIYTSCCNIDRGIYYYTTYNNRQITAIQMHRAPLNSKQLICYPLCHQQEISCAN